MTTQIKVENDEYAGFLARALRAYARRVGGGDIEALPLLVNLRQRVDDAILQAVADLRAEPWGYSWGEIARVLGITPQTAYERWMHSARLKPPARKPGGQPGHLR